MTGAAGPDAVWLTGQGVADDRSPFVEPAASGQQSSDPDTHAARTRPTRVMATGQKMGDRSETKVLDRAAFRIDPPRFGSRKGLLSSFVVRRSLIDRRRVATRISGSRSGSYPPKGPGNGISG